MFFVAFEKEFLSYRVIRSLFSSLSILEAVMTFILLNMVKKGFRLDSVDHWLPKTVLLWPVHLSNAAESTEEKSVDSAIKEGDLAALKALQRRGKFHPAMKIAG